LIDRRTLIFGGVAAVAVHGPVLAHKRPFTLDPKYAPRTVGIAGYEPGTIVIDPPNRFLYLVETEVSARRYGVGVGRAALAWSGEAVIGRKAKWPSWKPTANMIRRQPGRYARYARGVRGGPSNPLGARALYLYQEGRDTMYRIHGTTEPWTVGQAVSNGCVRLLNEHVVDLYERVAVGAPVIVLGPSVDPIVP
jgi:lipoprotein-anchoring transpeptidase ErfK/SrfK